MQKFGVNYLLRGSAAHGLAIAMGLLLAACTGPDRVRTADAQTPPPPPGVDAGLWSELTAELERVVQESGTARRSSAAPLGQGSSVQDLWVRDFGDPLGIGFWSARNQGDYDGNLVVTISDLTPIGLHFGKRSTDPDWLEAQLADGDGNLEINIGDVTPIGQNFGGRLDGYIVQRRSLTDSEWTTLATLDMEEAFEAWVYPRFEPILPDVQDFNYYRVVPYAMEGTQIQPGIPSREVLYSPNQCQQQWSHNGGDYQHSGSSVLPGPQSAAEAWIVPLEGHLTNHAPLADNEGNLYCATVLQSEGIIYSINREGDVNWRYRLPDKPLGPMSLDRGASVYVPVTAARMYKLSPDGKLDYVLSLPAVPTGAPVFNGVGDYCLPTQAPSLEAYYERGDEKWTQVLPGLPLGSPATDQDELNLFIANAAGTVTKHFGVTGNMTDSWSLGSEINPDLMIAENSILWAVSSTSMMAFALPLSFGADATVITVIELKSAATYWSDGSVCFGGSVPASDPLRGRLLSYGITGGGPLDSADLDGAVSSAIARDQQGRFYFATLGDATTRGMYCLDANMDELWHYPTGARYATAACIPESGALVFGVDTPAGSAADSELVMIR